MRAEPKSANSDLLDLLTEVLCRRGTVAGRRMFGGVGVYFDSIFFAIIDDGVVYFRASDAKKRTFEAEGSRAFTYQTKKGPAVLHSYWRLPERLLDDEAELEAWALDAIAAARELHMAKQIKTASPLRGSSASRAAKKAAGSRRKPVPKSR